MLSFRELKSSWERSQKEVMRSSDFHGEIHGPVLVTRDTSSMTVMFSDLASSVSDPSDIPLLKRALLGFLSKHGSLKISRTGPDELQVVMTDPVRTEPEEDSEVEQDAVKTEGAVIVGRRSWTRNHQT